MGILRTDVVSHSQLEPTGGSIYLDGTGDYLSIASADAFAFGTGAFTFECWVNRPSLSDVAQICGSGNDNFNFYFQADGRLSFYNGSGNITTTNTVSINTWTHVALCREGTGNGQMRVFIDGVQAMNSSNTTTYAAGTLLIGRNSASGSTYGKGYISNLRITRTAEYTKNFTVPKFELENIPGTILLCCRSSSSVTASDITYATITSSGDTTASAFAPDLKKDTTDTGVVLADNTKFDTLSYMVPSGGTTTQRGRGRGVLGGGAPFVSPNVINAMQYIEVQSGGIFKDFGDLTVARGYFPAGQTASSTRGISAGGWTGSANNTIDYITIATTSNATEFGDTVTARPSGGLSNQTRCVTAGDADNLGNTIEYLTIASTGNGTDFGDLTEGRGLLAGVASPTRGVFGGGRNNTPSSNTQKNTMEYITIASTGNAADFGDISSTRYGQTGFSSAVRGIWAGGYASPGQTKLIDYFTIATTGNSADFGDLSINNGYCSSVTNSIRGAVTINDAPNYYNTIEYITIATLGDSKDFGDSDPTGSGKGQGDFPSCMSDSHGGIS